MLYVSVEVRRDLHITIHGAIALHIACVYTRGLQQLWTSHVTGELKGLRGNFVSCKLLKQPSDSTDSFADDKIRELLPATYKTKTRTSSLCEQCMYLTLLVSLVIKAAIRFWYSQYLGTSSPKWVEKDANPVHILQ